jgi:6-phosphofructokinase
VIVTIEGSSCSSELVLTVYHILLTYATTHRKKINVAEFLAVDLMYFLRSGEPENYDKHMAIYYANLVMSSIKNGMHGVMAAQREGRLVYTDIPGKDLPARRVNPEDYHQSRYRPRFEHITGPYRPQERTLPI